jgi:ribosomal protein S18 acetylase RimI-like enzyme
MEDHSHSPIILPVPPEATHQALALVFSSLGPKQRDEQIDAVLPTPLPGDTPRAGLFGAYRQNELVGAIFAQLQPGKVAQVWLPRLVPGDVPETAVQLMREMNSWLQVQHVEMAQMLFEQISEAEECLLAKGGYDYLTDLLYLACLPEEFPASCPRSALEFLPYVPAHRERLKKLIDATYQNSLDCPKLNDVRDMEAVLEGYQSSGVFWPELWSIAQFDGQDAGCLLLIDHPEYDNTELVYMGVAPNMRGRGWGMEIARFAQWQAHCLGRDRLVVAVDATNQPAIAMYSAVGFRAWDRRRVYFWRKF